MDIEDKVQEDKQVMIVLTGNIGCGKTTVADWLMQNYEGRKIAVVSNDSITMMTSNGDYTRYQPRLDGMYKDMFFKCVCSAIDAGATVVCDNTHMTIKSRAKLLSIAKDSGLVCNSIDLGPGSPETLRRRQDAEDGRCVPNSTWCLVHQRFAKKYEPVTQAEGFDCVISGTEIQEMMYG